MIPYSPPRAVKTIPMIDLGALGRAAPAAEAAAALRRACLDTGFFYVCNHGVSEELVSSTLEWCTRFFDLPIATKLALAQSGSWARRGYEPAGAQALDNGSAPDLKESFRCGPTIDPTHPYARRRLATYGPSQWPDALQGFQSAMEDYANAVRGVGDRVLELVALSLDLAPRYFRDFYRDPMQTVRLLRYPPQATELGGNQLGAGAHTDWGGLTVLLQDGTGGLEVRNVAGEWVRATPIPGSFVVNIGELLSRWTNDLYQSNMHRVRNAAPANRHSVAFFYDPDHDARIECIASCLAPNAHPRRAPCTAGEHIAQMHAATARPL